MSHCSYKHQFAWSFPLFRTLPLPSCKRKLSVLSVEVWRGRVQGVAGSPKNIAVSAWQDFPQSANFKLKVCIGLWCGHTSSCTSTEKRLYSFFDSGFAHILGQIVSARVKTLSSVKEYQKKNASLLVDVDQEWRCAAYWVTHIWKFV